MTQTTLPAPINRDTYTTRFRRTAAGLCLIIGPLLLAAANLLSTQSDTNPEADLTTLATNGGREQISIMLFLLGFTLIVPGAFGMLALIRDRGKLLGNVGITLAVPGLMAFAGLVTNGVANIGIARAVPPAQGLTIIKSMENTGAANVIVLLGLLALPLGIIMLTFGVWRARVAPIWAPLLVVAAFAAVVVGEGMIGGIVGDLLMFIGLGAVGLRMICNHELS